jgi:GTP-binding protein
MGVVDGDKRVGGMVDEAGRACVVFVNKWDLVKGLTPKEFGSQLRDEMPFLKWAPIVVGSAETKKGMEDLLDTCADAANNHALRISTPELNRVIREAVDRRPYSSAGREFKIYYATQVRSKPPTFVLFVNNPKIAHETYVRYLENQLRGEFGFTGTPIRVLLRKREREEAAAR